MVKARGQVTVVGYLIRTQVTTQVAGKLWDLVMGSVRGQIVSQYPILVRGQLDSHAESYIFNHGPSGQNLG